MKVIVADKISERGVQLLKEQPGWNILLTTNDTLSKEIADADALIVRSATRVTAELLDQAKKLRAVGRAGVGVDNIDLEAATKRGVLVMSTPGGSSVSVAEHTFALLLALVRQLPKFDAAMREGRWEKSSSGAEVRGKTLGLIGLGRIGSEVASRAEAFDMRVVAFDPFISEAAARELSVELVPLDQLLAECDFISLHTAVSAQTREMINAGSIAKMKKGVRIVNAARGELINEADLAAAIKDGHVAGAALDVFAEEPPKNCPLIGLPNVIATPHVAGSTAEAQEELGTQVALQIKDYLAEGIIRNAVRREPAGSFGGPVPARAPVPGIGGAARLAGFAGGGVKAGADSHPVCGRGSRSRYASAAQRGVGGRAERSAGRKGERRQCTRGGRGKRLDRGRGDSQARTWLPEHPGSLRTAGKNRISARFYGRRHCAS